MLETKFVLILRFMDINMNLLAEFYIVKVVSVRNLVAFLMKLEQLIGNVQGMDDAVGTMVPCS